MFKMPAGRYYVGDLCYFIPDGEWINFLETGYFRDNDMREWKGQPYAMFGTAYGDGCYDGTDGHAYPVDSGTVGIIRVAPDFTLGDYQSLGQIVDFPEDFTCHNEPGHSSNIGGVLTFGHITINTDPEEDEEEFIDFEDEELYDEEEEENDDED